MAKAPTSVQNDFDSVVALLKAIGTLPNDAPTTQMTTARSVHSLTYSLILWRFRLSSLPDHGKVFVEEIASDALQILPQLLMGYSKTVKLLVRGIVENALRHLYFSDHPVEFARMNRDGKWYVTIEHLCEYAKQHPHFFQIERQFDAINQMSSVYSELSAGVHGRAVRDLEMRVALAKIKYDQAMAEKELALLRRCVVAVNFSLAIFHHQRMKSFQLEDRRMLLRTLPARARELWTEFEP
jgi:hypothetical protein